MIYFLAPVNTQLNVRPQPQLQHLQTEGIANEKSTHIHLRNRVSALPPRLRHIDIDIDEDGIPERYR